MIKQREETYLEAPTIKDLTGFTLKAYQKLLMHLNQTHKIVPLCMMPQKDIPYIILRHDIDLSISAALKMAKLEHDLNIKSTYFALFSSNFYNLHDGKTAQTLKQISNLGHEIGLHYDIQQYRLYNQNMNKTLKKETQLLEHLIGRKVYSIARHGEWDMDPFIKTKEYINANYPKIRGNLYVHDSCRTWITLEGLQQLISNPPKKVQLLVHPGNWNEEELDRETFTERFFQSLETKVSQQRKEVKELWTKDFIRKYDHSVSTGDFVHQQRLKKGNKLQGLTDYYKLFLLYIISTFWGWRIHVMFKKIRKIGNYV